MTALTPAGDDFKELFSIRRHIDYTHFISIFEAI
jgi:hypothetical protein